MTLYVSTRRRHPKRLRARRGRKLTPAARKSAERAAVDLLAQLLKGGLHVFDSIYEAGRRQGRRERE